MKNKSKKPARGMLQEWVIIEITDPAEQAALDKRCRDAEKILAEREAPKKSKPRKRK